MKKPTLRRLPDAEFEIMKVVWEVEPPVTTAMIMEDLGRRKGWKAPTIISFLLRLVTHGYLRTEKPGRERIYFPLVTEEDYLQFETERFVRTFHANSPVSFINTLLGGDEISNEELDELQRMIARKKREIRRASGKGDPS